MPERRFDELDRAVQAILDGATEIAIRKEIEPLVAIAADLRDLPRPEFKERLRRSLERRNAMPTAVSAILDVTPYVVAQDAEGVLEFVKDIFGAEEKYRAVGSAGGLHCEVQIGDANLMIGGGAKGLSWRGESAPAALQIFVDDVDGTYRRAMDAGATSDVPPGDREYGIHDASIRDPFGNEWFISRDLGTTEIWKGLRTVVPYFHPTNAGAMIDFLRDVLGAELIERYDEHGRVAHAKLRIGGAVVGMGEAHGAWKPMRSQMYVAVDDTDAAYARAVAGGAKPVNEPADAGYGRVGAVDDPFGHRWYFVAQKR